MAKWLEQAYLWHETGSHDQEVMSLNPVELNLECVVRLSKSYFIHIYI